MHWPLLSSKEIKQRVFAALKKNLNYRSEKILGIPATYLDTEVFYEDAPFLKDAPFLSMFIANPNHIGCHTLEGEKEPVFKGTQEIEKDLIRICAEEIFGCEKNGYDGYVASGGTEANIEACWIYRNYFFQEHGALPGEIAILCSHDSHYSFPKASDLLSLPLIRFAVRDKDREAYLEDVERKIAASVEKGIRYFIVNINLSTTMFGSVDNIEGITAILKKSGVLYKLHIDAAFGGFIYPFTSGSNSHSFVNTEVSSIAIDGHKMLQAPYGTGIFLVRKHLMQYVCTREAAYVKGKDYTLCGSRSGANAVCMWMILHMHGSEGWKVKMLQLLQKTTTLCNSLDDLGVEYYRNPFLNIIAIRSGFISQRLASAFMLVPDNYEDPEWYKIVVMPHVRQGILDDFLNQLSAELAFKKDN
jgi:tyrosine decarboxylase / aspartate 1-decarboxylase